MDRSPCVYILASRRNGTLYTGVTSDPVKRIWEHKNNVVDGFTKKYRVHLLVWYELHEIMESAIQREKNIKKWNRQWKLALIERTNPQWRDLYNDLTGFPINAFGNDPRFRHSGAGSQWVDCGNEEQ